LLKVSTKPFQSSPARGGVGMLAIAAMGVGGLCHASSDPHKHRDLRAPFASWAQPNLKSSAAVLCGFRLNKNARGQSSPELNS
jgi:hypothetical protein